MANLFEQLSKDRMAAFKAGAKEKASLLATVLAEAKNEALKEIKRDPTDDEVAAKIKKFLKGIEETMGHLSAQAGAQMAGQVEKLKAERATLEAYLPKPMSPDELKAAVEGLVANLQDKSQKAVGQVMQQLKAAYPDRIDMKKASDMVKQMLGGAG